MGSSFFSVWSPTRTFVTKEGLYFNLLRVEFNAPLIQSYVPCGRRGSGSSEESTQSKISVASAKSDGSKRSLGGMVYRTLKSRVNGFGFESLLITIGMFTKKKQVQSCDCVGNEHGMWVLKEVGE